MELDVLVENSRVVEGNLFEIFQSLLESLKLGKSSSSLGLDLELDLSNPPTLKLDSLSENFLLQSERDKNSHQSAWFRSLQVYLLGQRTRREGTKEDARLTSR